MKYAVYEETPPEAVESIKDVIEGKVVYEIGAGEGKFAAEMKRYAKNVVAIEMDPILLAECASRGLEAKYGNFMEMDLSEADVIFIFMSFLGNYNLTQKLKEDKWKGTVISHYYALSNSATDLLKPNKIIHANLSAGKIPFMIYNL